MTQAIRAGVIGVGRLGTFHAQKYQHLPAERVELAALVDPEVERVQREFPGVPVFKNVTALLAAESGGEIAPVDAFTVATPTVDHCSIGLQLLEKGKHVLIEKPLASTAAECARLNDAAAAAGCCLAVGHVERFRAREAFAGIKRPRFIECHRLAPFSFRSTDINVVQDLMIHDIDLMLSVVQAPLQSVHAAGLHVLTDKIDIANVRFEFEDGCVANLTSSRVTAKQQRKFRMFADNAYLSLDLAEGEFHRYTKDPAAEDLMESIQMESADLSVKDALLAEVEDFLGAVTERREPLVSGVAAQKAMEIAEQVLAEIEERLARQG